MGRWYRAAGVIFIGASLAAGVASLTAGEGQAVNRDRQGVAIDGYDPVAYFVDGKPVRGLAEFEQTWNGARYRFASAANRDRFANSPESFTPQYGGFCAFAVSRGYTADIDPAAWSVVDGKLYLNYDLACSGPGKATRRETSARRTRTGRRCGGSSRKR